MALSKKSKDITLLMDKYKLEIPKYWENWSVGKRLDWIGERILAESRRGVTSYSEMKEEGWLSSGQLYQRQLREVFYTYSEDEEFYDVPTRGVFSRKTERQEEKPLGEYYPKKSLREIRVSIQRHVI